MEGRSHGDGPLVVGFDYIEGVMRWYYRVVALQAGVHVKVVSERLGHSSITIALNTYSHAIPGLQRDAAERVAALIPGLGVAAVKWAGTSQRWCGRGAHIKW
jgi:hypothetical protein